MPLRANHQLHVAIATPLGRGGHGGIDRLMWQVADTIKEADSSVRLHMLVTRGQGHILGSIYWMLRALATMLCLRATGRIDILHVNLSSRGSTYRKIILCAFARMCGVPYAIHLHAGGYARLLVESQPGTKPANWTHVCRRQVRHRDGAGLAQCCYRAKCPRFRLAW